MGQLNDRVKELEEQVRVLQSAIESFSQNVEEKDASPNSMVGAIRPRALIRILDPNKGWGHLGGMLVWNDAELKNPGTNNKPDDPTEGYNKHSHSRYAGGALDVNTLELVEFIFDGDQNPHCQQFFEKAPSIANADKEGGGSVPKIGKLDVIFDAENAKWKVTAGEIDVRKTYLVMRDENGNLMTDEKGQVMKAPLYSTDQTKTNIIWDSNAKVWRILAVYADV